MRKRLRERGEGAMANRGTSGLLRNVSVHVGSVMSPWHWGAKKGEVERELESQFVGVGLSCCCCGCRSCMAKGRSWAGSRTYPALWGSRWWCRRWSAAAAWGRSWIFHLAADCFCSVSGTTAETEDGLNHQSPNKVTIWNINILQSIETTHCDTYTMYTYIKHADWPTNRKYCTQL